MPQVQGHQIGAVAQILGVLVVEEEGLGAGLHGGEGHHVGAEGPVVPDNLPDHADVGEGVLEGGVLRVGKAGLAQVHPGQGGEDLEYLIQVHPQAGQVVAGQVQRCHVGGDGLPVHVQLPQHRPALTPGGHVLDLWDGEPVGGQVNLPAQVPLALRLVQHLGVGHRRLRRSHGDLHVDLLRDVGAVQGVGGRRGRSGFRFRDSGSGGAGGGWGVGLAAAAAAQQQCRQSGQQNQVRDFSHFFIQLFP